MKNFNWTTFTRKMAIKASVSDLYDAWTIPEKLEEWFLETTRYFKKNGEQLPQNRHYEAGNTYEWTWYLYDGIEKGKVIETNGKDRIQFSFAGDCIVDVKISSLGEYSIVELTQKNIPTDEESKERIRLGCEGGWAFYLVNLKSVYENGNDLRNKEEILKNYINC